MGAGKGAVGDGERLGMNLVIKISGVILFFMPGLSIIVAILYVKETYRINKRTLYTSVSLRLLHKSIWDHIYVYMYVYVMASQ